MKVQVFMFVALCALALIAEPARAQSTADSQKSSNLSDPIAALLHLGAYAKAASPEAPARDAVALGLAKAKTYKFASADYPGAGTSLVIDENLNTILGDTQFNNLLGFTLKGSNYQLLVLPGRGANEATGINTSGQIVGIYLDASGVQHGFLDNAGVVTNIDDPAALPQQTTPLDLNDGGEIVGEYEDSALVIHGFWTTDGVTFNNVDFPAATSTLVSGVNTAGDIAGQWTDASMVDHGFLLHGGVYTSLDFPLAKGTTAFGINDSGEIAGYFSDASGVFHGFIYSGGSFTQIDVAGAAQTQLTRIKNNGRITGVYVDAKMPSGETHGLTGH
jgi:probable HAF family extracellular repeat protein